MSEVRSSSSTATEGWLGDAIRRGLHGLRLFAWTFTAFALRPGRSARAWRDGEQTFMNPLGFAATAAGTYWVAVGLLTVLWPIPGNDMANTLADTLADEFTLAVGPYVHYGLLGIAMHFGLRWLGSERRILASIGVALFAGGSIGTGTALLMTAIVRWFGHIRGTTALEIRSGDLVPLGLLVAAALSYGVLCLAMAGSMMGLHRTPVWKVVVAATFAVVVTALMFGSILHQGSFGWRPYVGIDLNNGSTLSFGFRL